MCQNEVLPEKSSFMVRSAASVVGKRTWCGNIAGGTGFQ